MMRITALLPFIDFAAADAPLNSKWTSIDLKFASYTSTFSKVYSTEGEAYAAFQAFIANDAKILEHNAKNSSYTLGHNEFSDLTWEQFSKVYVGGFDADTYLSRVRNYDHSLIKSTANLSDAVDWVAKGAVTPVKNQGQCGSCWAFSTTGSVEGALQIATGSLLSLSEQNLVSCDHDGDQGCKGGGMDTAFAWIKKNGICSEIEYPYTGVDGTCSACTPEVTLTGFTDVPAGDETSLLHAAGIGPVSVAIEADKDAFQLYNGGVLDSPDCGKTLDHGVLVVGYGSDSGKDYYKVKNSWGSAWGEEGYLRIVRNKDMCGIADMASYPTGVSTMGPLPPTPQPTPAPPTPPPGPAPSPATGCKYPQVMTCYTASLQTCWTPFQEKNKAAADALALLDAKVGSGIAKILIGGDTWNKTWTVNTEGEYAYISAYSFETYNFLSEYQFAQVTLQLSAGSDPKALDAYNKITDQFDGVFYDRAGCGVKNTASAVIVV